MSSFIDEICMKLPVAPTQAKRIAIRLKPKGVRAVRQGHPWVFEDSIERISHEGFAGDVCVLFDEAGSFLGAGLYDPTSSIRVRALLHGRRETLDEAFISKLVAQSLSIRAGRLPLETDAYRAINGDSDSFPGLVADIYADILAIKVYSAAWLPWLGSCVRAFFEQKPELKRFVLRLSRDLQKNLTDSQLADGLVLPISSPSTVVFRENGLKFEADPAHAQKTGFFLDQRDNRNEVGLLSAGKGSVLNLFSYTGGFSLYAARGGARKVVSVDFSRPAIEAAKRNFELNFDIPNVKACMHEGIVGDAFAVLDDISKSSRSFDVVVVDPPSFAKCEAEIPGALRSYGRLCKAALKALRKNGVLVFASCSSRVSSEDFFKTINAAASEVGRPLREFKRTEHAIDHPAKFKESSYLKCIYAEA